MKRFLPLVIIASAAALLLTAWLIFGGRVLRAYYTASYERALSDGRSEAAANAVEKLVALDPEDRRMRQTAADVLADAGMYSRAEYHLREAIAIGGPRPEETYAALSALYVRQDKIFDAIALLDEVRGVAADAVAEMRPDAPVPNTPPGKYERAVTLSFSVPDGCACYVSLTREYPSSEAPFAGKELDVGVTQARAVAVDARGVVSALWSGSFELSNINYPMVFAEPALEEALRAAINRPEGDVFSRDLSGVTSLEIAQENPYVTLADLAPLVGLERLYLKGTGERCDISALSGLSGLRELSLGAMGIDSLGLDALSGLENLENLSLAGNSLTALDGISGLTALKELSLASNSIINILPLETLTELTFLDISANSLQDIRPLGSLTKLTALNLSMNRISTLDGLENMKALDTLDFSSNAAFDISALASLTNITRINGSRNLLESIGALENLRKLTELDLSNNTITEIGALDALTALKTLSLDANQIESAAALGGLAALESLDLDNNALKSVEPLANLKNLAELRIENNAVSSLAPLLGCDAIKHIYAFGNGINALTLDPAFISRGITVYA
jgi:internalin A